MAKFVPLAPRKFRSGALKGFVLFFGILLLMSGFAAIILSFAFFWDAACASCSNVACTSNGVVGQEEMDWSFLILDVYFIVAVVVGPILLAAASNMTTKRSYLRAYPYAVFCPNCGTLADKRNGICHKCGIDIDPEGLFKYAPPPPNYNYSTNPYETYAKNRVEQNTKQSTAPNVEQNKNQPTAPTVEQNEKQNPNQFVSLNIEEISAELDNDKPKHKE